MKKQFIFLTLWGSLCMALAQGPYVFEEENGLVVIEAESNTGFGQWTPDTAIQGFSGDHYLVYQGVNYYNAPGNSLLKYYVNISKAGTYRFQWRSRITTGTSNTDHNDSWLRIPDAAAFYAQKSTNILYPHGSGMTPNPDGAGKDGWFKVYQNALNAWTWNTSTNDHDPHSIFVEFDSVGIYTIEISGRSTGHGIDRIVMYHSEVSSATALDLALPESPKSILSSIDDVIMDLKILSHPAAGYVEVLVPQPLLPQSLYSLKILDISGRVIRQLPGKILTENRGRIPVADLAPGVYVILLGSEGVLYKGRFLRL